MSSGARSSRFIFLVVLGALVALGATVLRAERSGEESRQRPFTSDFRLEDCSFSSNSGANPFFSLEPGRRLTLKGEENKAEIELQIIVLRETEDVRLPGVGVIRTRVVEEREWVDDELAEVSRNFFAICEQTSNVFYFGEDVDIFEGGVVVSHEGAWRAGVNGATPGIIMPGSFLLGSRYFQEVAPGVALDRGENLAMGLEVDVPAGTFRDCVSVLETSALSTGKGIKTYAPGVGLITDESLLLDSWAP
jgi:hypothetical protein